MVTLIAWVFTAIFIAHPTAEYIFDDAQPDPIVQQVEES